jgi:hypothetical protein
MTVGSATPMAAIRLAYRLTDLRVMHGYVPVLVRAVEW